MSWGDLRSWRRRRCRQGGFALVEAIAALLLLAVGMTAVLSSAISLLFLTSAHRDRVRSGVEAIDIAERIENAPYVPCSPVTQVRSALSFPATLDGFVLDVSKVQYLQSRAAATASWIDSASACQAGGDQGLQRVEISVSRPNGRGVEKLWFVARDDTCRNITTVPGQRC